MTWDEVDRAVEHVVSTLLRFDEVLGLPDPDVDVLGSARPTGPSPARRRPSRSSSFATNRWTACRCCR